MWFRGQVWSTVSAYRRCMYMYWATRNYALRNKWNYAETETEIETVKSRNPYIPGKRGRLICFLHTRSDVPRRTKIWWWNTIGQLDLLISIIKGWRSGEKTSQGWDIYKFYLYFASRRLLSSPPGKAIDEDRIERKETSGTFLLGIGRCYTDSSVLKFGLMLLECRFFI